MATARITDGVFAVNKPAGISSAQVLRELQKVFKSSKLFAQALEEERKIQSAKKTKGKKWKRFNRDVEVKIGHGGTLDPMATGVLIAGVGRGTKALGNFCVDCTKSYDAVALFGCSTDTYDSKGKIFERTPYSHITRDLIEKALPKFRGDIIQKPPIYSALHINGKRMYQYAREGKPLPVEIKGRPVTVASFEILKFVPGYGPEAHSWEYPAEHSLEQEVEIAQALEAERTHGGENDNHSGGSNDITSTPEKSVGDSGDDAVRKRQPRESDTSEERNRNSAKRLKVKSFESSTGSLDQGDAVVDSNSVDKKNEDVTADVATLVEEGNKEGTSKIQGFHETDPPPAVHLSMTVSSGTYVRSLIHDLGKELGSSAHMVSLVRSRQGEFELGKNVLEWDIFSEEDSSKWEEQLEKALENWNSSHV